MNKHEEIYNKLKTEYQDDQVFKELDKFAFENTKQLAREIRLKVQEVNHYTHQPARFKREKELQEYLLKKVVYYLKVNYFC
jgi:hypothetical protein